MRVAESVRAGGRQELVCGQIAIAQRGRVLATNPNAVDTPVRLLVVDLDTTHLTPVSDIAEEEGIDIRTAIDANGAIRQCRLEYLDLVMINAGIDNASGVDVLETIRTLRPTVRAVLMNGAQVPLRQMLRELRNEPRHIPCFDEFQPGAPALAFHAHA
jgi:PleD family two-component response regulator